MNFYVCFIIFILYNSFVDFKNLLNFILIEVLGVKEWGDGQGFQRFKINILCFVFEIFVGRQMCRESMICL